MGSVELVYRNEDGGKPGNYRASWLACTGGGGLRLLKQAAGLGDELRHFKRLHQAGNTIFLEEGAFITQMHSVGKSEQDVSFHSGAIFFEPLAGLFCAPLSRHVAIHNECVEGF